MTQLADGAAPPVLQEQRSDGVALLMLNRQGARNALNMQTWEALESALDDVALNPTNRAVVLSGAGTYFCAGGDLKTSPAGGFGATAVVARLQTAHRIIMKLRRFPLPVIAAVEGGAAGMGWSLALASDVVFAAAEAQFVAPFVKRGVVPDGGAGWLLTQRIGRHRAAELLFSGRPIRGDEACRLGLVNRLCPEGQVLEAAIAFAAGLPAEQAQAMELTKRLLEAAEHMNFASYLDLELTTAALTQTGGEARRARLDFTQGSRS